MSIYAALDTGEQEQVASNLGWGYFSRWCDTLDHEDYPELAHLVDHGWTEDLAALHDQLAQAISSESPDPDVKSVGKELLTALATGRKAAVVVITDGLGPDTETTEGFDPNEPRAADGEWGSGGATKAIPTGHGAAQEKAQSILSRAGEKLTAAGRQAVEAAGTYLQKKYADLETQYGRAGAIAILGAMVAMAPVPVPGSMFAPIAIAKAYVAIKGRLKGGAA